MKRDSIQWKCAVLKELTSELSHNVHVVNMFHEDLSLSDKNDLDVALKKIRELNSIVDKLTANVLKESSTIAQLVDGAGI
jgi:hypothetical protein